MGDKKNAFVSGSQIARDESMNIFRGTTLVGGLCRPLRHPMNAFSFSRWISV
jgi:hypothetical protein